ncbi:hypothetical protein V6N13_062923 [Hibiscus sabdariffa]|uniref:Uncharacterized protein n=2 Tax=Hibiscus sabdariffa TaxID=183260 RepID=A0ABR2NDT0_9ROSI
MSDAGKVVYSMDETNKEIGQDEMGVYNYNRGSNSRAIDVSMPIEGVAGGVVGIVAQVGRVNCLNPQWLRLSLDFAT